MRKKFLLSVLCLIFMITPVFANIGFYYDASSDSVPQPVLISPVTSEVDLTGKDSLEFKWSPHEGDISQRKYYDFRLYKGLQLYEKNLIFKEQVPPNEHSITLKADLFEGGQMYVWSLRQKYRTKRGRRSSITFKLIKKK